MIDYKEVGKRIRFYRKKSGYTQEQLAFELQTSAAYLSNIERAIKKPSLHKLQQIADCLNIPLNNLIVSSPIPSPPVASPSKAFSPISDSDRARLINNLYEIINILEHSN